MVIPSDSKSGFAAYDFIDFRQATPSGVTVLISQIFPDRSAISLELFAEDGTVNVVSLDVYTLAQ